MIDPRAKLCMPCWGKSNTGAASPSWKGGRTRNVRGYILVKRHDHPFANAQHYIPEHRVVMEAKLGRYLLPGETVHHINGVKDDNRSDNLELWAKSQPAGQRAVDLLAWAREIVARYEPVEALLVELPFEAAVAQ